MANHIILILLFLGLSIIHAATTIVDVTPSSKAQRNLQSSSCSFISFAESYKAIYKASNFTITPTFNMKCNGQSYNIIAGTTSNSAILFNITTLKLLISDWSSLSNNSFLNITETITVINTN